MLYWLCLAIFGVCFLNTGAKTKESGQRLKYYTDDALRNLAVRLFDNEGFKRESKPFMRERMPDTDGIRAVQNHIVDRLTKLDWDVELDSFEDDTPFDTKTFTNIIATLNPRASYRLVLACHYDSKNMTYEKGSQKGVFIGAVDSAIPCGILMDMAMQMDCLFQKSKENLDLTVQLIFFDGEEAYHEWTHTDSLYGSRHLANRWYNEDDPNVPNKKKIDTIKLFVLLDLIGTRDIHFCNLDMRSQKYFEELVKIEKNLKKQKLLNSMGTSVNSRLFDDLPCPWVGGVQDDHIPFDDHKRSILHLISLPFPSVWHTFQDNEDALDYEVTDNFNRIFRVFVARYLHLDPLKGACKKK
ncbi:hypothetical protein ScPMuIL_013499 [Solemya velum]